MAVTDADWRVGARASKTICRWATAVESERAFEAFVAKREENYSTVVKQWRLKWRDKSTLFNAPPATRNAITTTTAIESVNGAIRNFTRNRKQDAESALKSVYRVLHEASKQ